MAIEEEPPAGIPEWVVTFGDMMSLLLCFFILLFAMSKTEKSQFKAMADSLREQFGHAKSRRTPLPGPNPQMQSRMKRTGSEEFTRQDEKENGTAKRPRKGQDLRRVWIARPGDQPTVGATLFFANQAGDLPPELQKELRLAAEELRGKTNRIEIRGHTSARPLPLGSPYADDWQLAYARCHATMQFLVEQEGIDRERIRLSVAGKNEPQYLRGNAEELAKNNRVEVYMLSELVPRHERDQIEW